MYLYIHVCIGCLYEYSCPCCACVLNSNDWDTSWSFKRCRNSDCISFSNTGDMGFDKFSPLLQLQLQDDILRQVLHLRNVNYVQGRWLSDNLSVIALLCVRALYPPLQMHICITNWGFDSNDKKWVHSFHTYTCILMYGMCYSWYACFYIRYNWMSCTRVGRQIHEPQ